MYSSFCEAKRLHTVGGIATSSHNKDANKSELKLSLSSSFLFIQRFQASCEFIHSQLKLLRVTRHPLSSIKPSDAVRFTSVEIPFKKVFCGRCTSGTRRPINDDNSVGHLTTFTVTVTLESGTKQ